MACTDPAFHTVIERDCEVTTMKHFAHNPFLCTFVSFCIVTAALLTGSQLSALELNQAIENCRASSGKPAYMACVQGGGTHEACFERARSIVHSCAKSAMTAARPKAALFSVEKLSAPPVDSGKP